MANLYFRNAGSSSWSLATNWSLTNGGPGDGYMPTAADNVFVTSLSFNTINIGTSGVCASIDFTGYSGTVTGASGLTVSGNVTLSATMTITWTGALIVNATASLRSNGKTLNGGFTFNAAGTYTLLDDWRTTAGFTSTVASKVINGFTIYIGGGLTHTTTSVNTSGTTNLVLNGTGTWSSSNSSPIQNNLTIDTLGTITLGTNVAYNTGTLRYVRGTIISTGNTLTCPAAAIPTTTFDTNTMVWNNVTLSGTGPYTLLSDMRMAGTFASNTNSKVINGFTMYIGGGFSVIASSTTTSGTTHMILNGTGSVPSGSASSILQNNLTINTTGTITFVGIFAYNTGTLTYIAGTVITTGSTLNCSAPTTLNTNGITWNNVTWQGTGTYTLLSNMTIANTFVCNTLSKTINGFTIFIGGNFTCTTGATIHDGTTVLYFNGTSTLSNTGTSTQLRLNIIIDTTGIITITSQLVFNGATLKYIKGTVITTGSTLTCSTLDTVLDTTNTATGDKITWNNVTLGGNGFTHTLLSDLWMTGLLTSTGNGTRTINGATLYLGGNLTFSTNNSITEGTTHIVINGDCVWTSGNSTSRVLRNNLTIDTLGSFGLGTNVGYNTGTVRYIKGTINHTADTTMGVAANTTFDTGGMQWVRISVTTTVTLTLLSTLNMISLFCTNNGMVTFAGAFGFVTDNISFTATTAQCGLILTPGNTYRMTTAFGSNSQKITLSVIKSAVPGTRATFFMDEGAACKMGFITLTDIDASAGRPINTYMGIVTNCINVNAYGDPIITIAKSFAA